MVQKITFIICVSFLIVSIDDTHVSGLHVERYLHSQTVNTATIRIEKQQKIHKGLYYQSTSQKLAHNVSSNNLSQKSVYCGYDPTNDSLHLGNLVSIIMMGRLSLLGLKPIFLVGGATGLIGDPSGKFKERTLLEEQIILNNIDALRSEISSVYRNIQIQMKRHQLQYQINDEELNISELNNFKLVNNYEFYKEMNAIKFLRDVGKIFRMSSLLNKQTVARRLDSQEGISYAEFSYSIIQAYDFLMLYQTQNCVLQFGGSDQWGNITNGCELVRKVTGNEVNGITMPLLLTKAGKKFGKSEGNALYLNAEKSSTDSIFNYFYNTADEDVERYLKIFTFYPQEKINSIIKDHEKKKERKIAQTLLAESVLRVIRSGNTSMAAERQFFTLSHEQLLQKERAFFEKLFNRMQKDNNEYYTVSKEERQNTKTITDLFVSKKMAKSKSEVRRQVEKGGLYINNARFQMKEDCLNQFFEKHLLHGKYILVRWGKKRYQFIRFQQQLDGFV